MSRSKAAALATVEETTALVRSSMDSGYPIITADRPPRAVMEDVTRLMVAFPPIGMPEGDKVVAMSLYFEAVAPFDLPIVLYTLKWLRYNNPRNTPTFVAPPTPQDVRQACRTTANDWTTRICRYYFDRDDPKTAWVKPTSPMTMGGRNFKVVKHRPSLASLNDPNCIIPLPVICGVLRRYMDFDDYLKALLEMPDERFEAVPEEGFRTGLRDELLAHRNELKAAKEKRAEVRAYVRTLTSEQRRVRRILNHEMDVAEEVLMSKVNYFLEHKKMPDVAEPSVSDRRLARRLQECCLGMRGYFGEPIDPDDEAYDVSDDILRKDFVSPLFKSVSRRVDELGDKWRRISQTDDLGNPLPFIAEPF